MANDGVSLILITGSDDYAVRREATQRLVALCGEPPEANPKLEVIHGDSNTSNENCFRELVASINTPPFLEASKVIWLKKVDFAKELKTNKNVEELTAEIKKGLPDDVVVVMDGTGMDRRSSLFKACKKYGEVIFHERLDSSKSRDWERNVRAKVMEVCHQLGVDIAPDAASFMAETCGTDSGRAVSEAEKLAAYVSPRKIITMEDCKAVCSATPEAAGWAFSDALAKRSMDDALRALDILYSKTDRHIGMIILLSRTFIDMAGIWADAGKLSIPANAQYQRFKSATEHADTELKEQLRGHAILSMHPYRAWMLFSNASKFGDVKLASILTDILHTNREMVSGGCNERILLETLAAKICAR